MVGGEGDDQLWGSGRWTLLGASAGCHCSVLWLGGGFSLHWYITQKLFFAIWGLCWYNFFKVMTQKTKNSRKTKKNKHEPQTKHSLKSFVFFGFLVFSRFFWFWFWFWFGGLWWGNCLWFLGFGFLVLLGKKFADLQDALWEDVFQMIDVF